MDEERQRWILPGVGLLAVAAVLATFAIFLNPPGERLGSFLVGFGLTAFFVGTALVPRLRALFLTVVSWYFGFALLLGVVTVPMLLSRWASEALLARDVLWLQVATLSVWGVVLVAAAGLVLYGPARKRLFDRLPRLRMVVPLVYAFALLAIAIQFFATLGYLLHLGTGLTFIPRPDEVVSAATVADFFLWHFADAVPFLDLPGTLRWEEAPLGYGQARVGWLLIAFKIVVILPVIAAFAAGWKRFREAPADEEGPAPDPGWGALGDDRLAPRRRAWMAAVQEGRADPLADLVTDDVVWFRRSGAPLEGRAAFRAWLQELFGHLVQTLALEPVEVRIFEGWRLEAGRFRSELGLPDGSARKARVGAYLALWRLEADGVWRIERYLEGMGPAGA